jgi:dienelactone hydrolase
LSSKYRLRHEHQYKRNLTAWARWVRPDGTQRRHCLVYVHGWLEPGSWVEENFIFPGWGRQLGADLVHVALPFHGVRNPRTSLFSGEYFWTGDLVRSLESLRQAICDARSVVAWMRGQGYEHVGVTGLSFGGSIAMMLACLEPLPDYIIAIVGHLALGEASESAEILWRAKRDLQRWGVDETTRRRTWARLGVDSARPLLPPERQLWIEAENDAHIDPALVRAQWESWNHPNLHWIQGGHMTFPLHMNEITKTMREFMDSVSRSTERHAEDAPDPGHERRL